MAVVYVNEHEWAKEWAGIPAALRQRRMDEKEEFANTFGVTLLESGNQNGAGMLLVTLMYLKKPADFFSWLDVVHAVAVDIHFGDVPYLMGRTLESLMLKRALERGEVTLPRLEVHEITPTLNRLGADLATDGGEVEPGSLSEAQAMDDLVNGGFLPESARAEMNARNRGVSNGRDEFGAWPATGRHAAINPGPLPKEWTDEKPSAYDPFF